MQCYGPGGRWHHIMNNQIRAMAVLLGALVVALTYTFPFWQNYINLLPGGTGVIIPCLDPRMNEGFLAIDETTRDALVELSDENSDLACELIFAHLGPDAPVPQAQQSLPDDLVGRIQIAGGDLIAGQPAIEAEGILSVYELADGRSVLRFDDFHITNVPGMQVWLSGTARPVDEEELQEGGIYQIIEDLQGNIGGQTYILAADVDLSQYNSIVIYSETLGIVAGYAPFAFRNF
jgi:hypothetical protein